MELRTVTIATLYGVRVIIYTNNFPGPENLELKMFTLDSQEKLDMHPESTQ